MNVVAGEDLVDWQRLLVEPRNPSHVEDQVKREAKPPIAKSKAGKPMNTENDGARNAAAEAAREAAKSRSAASGQAPGNVDKIRDILFGSQMRDYEGRFTRLEESLRKESSDLRDSTKKRLDALESYIKKELESLESRLKNERQERAESHEQLSAELKSASVSLGKKIAEVENQNGQAHRDVRKELLEQSNNLSEEISAKSEELASLLDRRVQELRRDKTDRAALAGFLTEVAMRLNEEFQIPGAE
jgi:hypothetical protein